MATDLGLGPVRVMGARHSHLPHRGIFLRSVMSPIFAFIGSEFQWMFIALIVLLLFGNRLPSVMRSMGQGVAEFKKGINGIEDDEVKREQPPKLDEMCCE